MEIPVDLDVFLVIVLNRLARCMEVVEAVPPSQCWNRFHQVGLTRNFSVLGTQAIDTECRTVFPVVMNSLIGCLGDFGILP